MLYNTLHRNVIKYAIYVIMLRSTYDSMCQCVESGLSIMLNFMLNFMLYIIIYSIVRYRTKHQLI